MTRLRAASFAWLLFSFLKEIFIRDGSWSFCLASSLPKKPALMDASSRSVRDGG
jgi:hypothetical protein